MIKISLKGLAKFMAGNSAQQRKVLRDFKYPDPEGFAQTIYYREARDFITAYHQNRQPIQWLFDRASQLDAIADQSSGQTTTRYKNNARAIRGYARYFGNRKFEVLPDVSLAVTYAGVMVTVFPDLHVRENRAEKIIKFEFSKDAPDDKMVKVIAQAMYEAQSNDGMRLKSSSVLYIDVRRGVTHKGARAGSRMRHEMEAACKNISTLWNGI